MPIVTNPSLLDNSHERLQSSRHCVFRCGDSWYSVPATAIREVTIAPEPVRLPGAPAWLNGIVHLQSEFIPVISLSRFLDIPTNTETQPGRLLVIHGNPIWAIQVCEVAALSDLDATLSPGSQMAACQPTGIVGTFTWGSHIARVLEPRHTLSRIQKSLHDRWNPLSSGGRERSTCPSTITMESATQ
jgi:chemotaxis signal transduction protein